jgi:hypothetical protein
VQKEGEESQLEADECQVAAAAAAVHVAAAVENSCEEPSTLTSYDCSPETE